MRRLAILRLAVNPLATVGRSVVLTVVALTVLSLTASPLAPPPRPPRPPQHDLNGHSGRVEHADQRVDAEQLQLAPNEVTDPRLRHAKEHRRFPLTQPAPLDHLAQGLDELRP